MIPTPVPPAGLLEVNNLFKTFISLLVPAAFIVLLIVLVIAGIKFLTSGGESKAVQSATGAVTWAILGVIFLILAWLILRLVEAFTGVSVTNFCIGFKPFC